MSQVRLDVGEESLEVLRQEVPLQIETAGAELERARAEYATAEADEQKIRRDSERPMAYPKGGCKLAGEPQAEAQLEAIRRGVARGQPYGGEQWVGRPAKQLGLESTLRAPHRPRKGQPNQ